jgi:hypothetical protein
VHRFHFHLVGPRPASDEDGLVLRDVQFAANFAEKLAADLFLVRPELRGNTSVVMTDGKQNAITYCVAIPPDHAIKAA